MRLILASQNPGKQTELRALLDDLPLDLIVPQQLGRALDIEESGADYAENALIKARAFSETFGYWTLGDDTGLEVEALDGGPGLHSARLVAEGGSDEDRRKRLLALLVKKPPPWRARFVCVVALVGPQGDFKLRRGECPGEIIPVARGLGGFGYDPIFLVEGTNMTMAELTVEEKNKLSHRAIATQAMRPWIKKLMEGGKFE
jgi:XTP/dITP diphosphohydrolase